MSALGKGKGKAPVSAPLSSRPSAAAQKGPLIKGKAGEGKPAGAAAAASQPGPSPASASASGDRLPTADWEIPYSQLEMFEQIGSGGFGVVKRAKWNR
jgi:hypothetical protein